MRALFLVGLGLTGCSASAVTRADAGAVTKFGTITIEQGTKYTEIFATFRTRTLLEQEPGCRVVVSGNCTAEDCRSAVFDHVSDAFQSAGTLDVTGPSLDAHLVLKSDLAQYGTTLSGQVQWVGTEVLTVTGWA